MEQARKRGRLADGYGSDDERPKLSPFGYGALPGDKPRRPRRPGEVEDYALRQASGKLRALKPRFLDAFAADPGSRLAPSQTQARGLYDRHLHLLTVARRNREANKGFKSDRQLLHENHRFLREDEDEDGSWEADLAKRYYARLFREYVICDLAGYKTGAVGFRWRTVAEVYQGAGQFSCGQKICGSKSGLRSYEVDFKYVEVGRPKRALVKARLCERCAYRLHYRRVRDKRRRLRKEERRSRKRPPTEQADDDASEQTCAPSDGDGQASLARGASAPSDDERSSEVDGRDMERQAWTGPDPALRCRNDEFDDFFNEFLT